MQQTEGTRRTPKKAVIRNLAVTRSCLVTMLTLRLNNSERLGQHVFINGQQRSNLLVLKILYSLLSIVSNQHDLLENTVRTPKKKEREKGPRKGKPRLLIQVFQRRKKRNHLHWLGDVGHRRIYNYTIYSHSPLYR